MFQKRVYIKIAAVKLKYFGSLNRIIHFYRQHEHWLLRFKFLISLGGLGIVAIVLYMTLQILLAPKNPVTTYSLPYTQTFDDVNLRNWFSKSGVWTLRSGSLSQTIGGEEPNFLHIPLKLPEDTPYHASVFITLKKDTTAAGLTFNAQYPKLTEQQHRVYIFRPTKTTLQLVAGYMDATGSFVPQAQIPLDINTTEFRLDLYVYSDTYLIQLNGQRLIENRPLFYHNGMLGFYTIASAVFDNLQITAADNPNPGDQVYTSDFDQDPGGAGWVPFKGDWRIINGQMTQNDPTAIDAGSGYESSTFQNYVLRTNFSLIQGSGAGLLFNMPSPYQLNGAHMVRFSDEADVLLWGYYDAKGLFIRQGYLNIDSPGTGEHSLKIFSGQNSYDIFLDETLVARDIPLQETRGSVGLVTSRASAGFSFVEVFPLFGADNVTPQVLTPVISATPSPKQTALPAAPTSQASAAPSKASATAQKPETTAQKPETTAQKPEATAQKTEASATTSSAAPSSSATDGNAVVTGESTSYKGDFTGDFKTSGWKVIRGDWAFSGGNLVQTDAQATDLSIVYTPVDYTNFSVTIGLTHQDGFGGGLLFNMPYTDRLNGAHLVRYSDRRPGAIFWGYFDDSGKFVGEGYADVPEASTDHHLFRVVSKKSTYDIYLDNNLIVKDLPFKQNYGHIGLLTSRTSVSYDQVEITGSTAKPPESTTNAVDPLSDLKILSGKWDTQNNVITQQVTEIGEYILNSGTYATEYTIEAEISLPNGGQTGGGFIFHMPDRGTRKGAYLVRLVNGGESIFWGYFDENSKFKGIGSAKLTKAASYVLKLAVRGNLMNVYVNDQMILQDMKLTSTEGWLGLLAHGGVVQFKNVKATITTLPGKTP